MRILNIGFDKSLAGGKGLGDAVARHREYGRYLKSLDIIVYTTQADGLTLPYKISENVTGYPTNSRSKPAFIWDAYRLAKSIYKKQPYDIVVAQDTLGPDLVGYALKKKFGVRLQINFHGDPWSNRRHLKMDWRRYFLLPFSLFFVKRADGLRVVSSWIKQKLINLGIEEEKIALLPTPVNFSDFQNPTHEEVQKLLDKYKSKKLILSAGRHVASKNLEGLLEAFIVIKSAVPNTVLILAGEGETTNGLKRRVKDLNIESAVDFTGGLSPRVLSNYMAASTMLVFSSFTESLGKVLIEAALAGKPVVTTATTGARDIVEDGKSGYLVPVGDMDALAHRVIDLLKNPGMGKEMGHYAQATVRKKFDREKIVKGIIDFWEKLANTKTAKG